MSLLSAVVPVTLAGENNTHAITYLNALIESLAFFWVEPNPLRLLVVSPQAERAAIEAHTKPHPNVAPLFLAEQDVVPQFARYPQMSGYFKQMILKLAISARIETDFYLTLDTDIFCIRPIAAATLLPHGKALTEWEDKAAHPEWWHASAALLRQPPSIAGKGLGVTPNILATPLAQATLQRVATAWGGDPLDQLASRGQFQTGIWTEYSLYTLGAGEDLTRYHHPPEASPGAANKLHSDTCALWGQEALTHFNPADRVTRSSAGFFAIVQSSLRIDPGAIHEGFRHALAMPRAASA